MNDQANELSATSLSEAELSQIKTKFEQRLVEARSDLVKVLDLQNEEKQKTDVDQSTIELLQQFHERQSELIGYLEKSLVKIENRTFVINKAIGIPIDFESLRTPPHKKLKK